MAAVSRDLRTLTHALASNFLADLPADYDSAQMRRLLCVQSGLLDINPSRTWTASGLQRWYGGVDRCLARLDIGLAIQRVQDPTERYDLDLDPGTQRDTQSVLHLLSVRTAPTTLAWIHRRADECLQRPLHGPPLPGTTYASLAEVACMALQRYGLTEDPRIISAVTATNLELLPRLLGADAPHPDIESCLRLLQLLGYTVVVTCAGAPAGRIVLPPRADGRAHPWDTVRAQPLSDLLQQAYLPREAPSETVLNNAIATILKARRARRAGQGNQAKRHEHSAVTASGLPLRELDRRAGLQLLDGASLSWRRAQDNKALLAAARQPAQPRVPALSLLPQPPANAPATITPFRQPAMPTWTRTRFRWAKA